MTWQEFWVRVGIALVLTPVVKLIGGLFTDSLAWWLAAVIALALVFLGELFIPD